MTILDSLVEGALCLGNRRESNELLGMMVRYLVTGEVPEPRTDAQRMAITMIMPVLENSRARAEAGRKGGQSKGKPKANQRANAQAKPKANARAKRKANPKANQRANAQAKRKRKGKRS